MLQDVSVVVEDFLVVDFFNAVPLAASGLALATCKTAGFYWFRTC